MIGYYIHHHGNGHLNRARAITRHLSDPVVALTSLDLQAREFSAVVRLQRDDNGSPDDVTASGALHWAPRADDGLRARMSQIAEFVADRRPAAIVVDVSVEVAVFVRLMGVPVIVMAMPGDRGDPAHQLAYRVADAIIAPWPGDLSQPVWLHEHLTKTSFTGGISRHDGRCRRSSAALASDVLVMSGSGGTRTAPGEVAELADEHPELTVRALGAAFDNWVSDPWPYLCSAGIVVIDAGQGSVADTAAAGRPAVILPQDRPFAEQQATAATLDRSGLAHVSQRWPTPYEWRELLTAAEDEPPWSRWHTLGAAQRAAAAIGAVAS